VDTKAFITGSRAYGLPRPDSEAGTDFLKCKAPVTREQAKSVFRLKRYNFRSGPLVRDSMKLDERKFLIELGRVRPKQTVDGPTAEDVGLRLGLSTTRINFILNKWDIRGWWDCGVTLRSGWLTKLGRWAAAASEPGGDPSGPGGCPAGT
jgi:hypothetical protein